MPRADEWRFLAEEARPRSRAVNLLPLLRLLVFTLFVLALTLLLIPRPASAELAKKRVLVLHSYHKGFKWTDDITQGIDSVFAGARFPLDVNYEFMDTKKLFDKVYQQQLLEIYRHKYADQKFDVILSSDDNAFNFLVTHRQKLFPDTPVVFCGVNYFNPERLQGQTGFTGVNEAASIEGNLDLILQLYPQVRKVAMVYDQTTTGKRVEARYRELAPQFAGRLEFIELTDLTMPQMEERLQQLGPDTVVFYTIFFRDSAERFFEYDESIARVVAASAVPVHITWDFSLGTGAVGGLLTSGRSQGETAARMVLRVLQGDAVDSLPVVMKSPNIYMFDYPVLQKYGIDRKALPAGALVLHSPDELYARYRSMIYWGLGVIAGLTVIVILLGTQILRRRRAEAALQRANEELEERVRLRTKDLMLTNSRLNDEIEQHERAERQVLKLTRAVDQSSCSVIIIDRNFHIEYVNPKFTEITGYLPEEVLGQTLGLLKGEPWNTDYDGKRRALLEGQDWRGEFYNRRKDGTLYFEMAAMSPIFDDDGNLTNYVSINEDITERKMADKALNQALAEAVELSHKLEQANSQMQAKTAEVEAAYDKLKSTQSQMLQSEKMASIGQLAAGVAHEINNPMGFIAGNLRALQKYLAKFGDFISAQQEALTANAPDEINDALKAKAKQDKIDFLLEDSTDLITESLEGAERVKQIVQNLKTFSRVDQAERKPSDLNECLDSTINIVWNELKYKATLEKEYGDLPLVDCYPQQLNQVFMNILVNAAQSIKEQGVIRVRTEAQGDQVQVAISDTGCGIPPDNLERIFEPFFTTKDVGKGTGLGMSIAYDIVQRHGGTITVDSTVDVGTTFTITLPVAGPPATDAVE